MATVTNGLIRLLLAAVHDSGKRFPRAVPIATHKSLRGTVSHSSTLRLGGEFAATGSWNSHLRESCKIPVSRVAPRGSTRNVPAPSGVALGEVDGQIETESGSPQAESRARSRVRTSRCDVSDSALLSLEEFPQELSLSKPPSAS